ncbi:MAG: hypothetical protein ACQESR_25515 [Planctomycetota bacterium]
MERIAAVNHELGLPMLLITTPLNCTTAAGGIARRAGRPIPSHGAGDRPFWIITGSRCRMRSLIFTLFMTLTIGCACQSGQKGALDEATTDETMENLVFVAPTSRNPPSYPLMCVKGGDYPDGIELIFRKRENDKTWIHAVFPEGVKAPDKLEGEMVLRGHFQKIQNRDRFVYKNPPKDYQYFVVTSWTKQERNP